MNAKKILLPTDFSTLSDAALEHATALAKERGAELLIVHVAEPPAAYGGGEMYYGLANPDTPELQRMLAAVVPDTPTARRQRSNSSSTSASQNSIRAGRRRGPFA